jgi:hypothetical protein
VLLVGSKIFCRILCHRFIMWLVVGTVLLLAAAVCTLENRSLDQRIDPYVCAKRKYFK